ncbi:fumarylacetoacetate hydrolase family protein (plasmid) [Embleya sp. NBC_00888]|uniref:2-keto-4-pentenoate hydratase n=1 Tax=Embleya sp. NBC_00888 TaxID=2975960 RepID=UPI002F917D72|nr:fumarylacetoacetate hydrolase family protein [Embleya sp. NBC_00888]
MAGPERSWTSEIVAELLLDAEARRTPTEGIASRWPEFDLDAAYRAQDLAVRLRVARGERIVGVKLGLTSVAKQRQMHVDTPSIAWLTDTMELAPGTAVPTDRLIHPRAEPEIVFVLGSELRGPGVTAARAMQSVASVVGGIEIIDSRFTGFSFTLPDVVADNNSSSRYITGPLQLPPDGLDLALEGCLLEVDGQVVDSATGAAILGNPAHALAFAANELAKRGQALEAGWVVLTGGLTEAVPLHPGSRVAVHFTHLGSIVIKAD